MNQHKHILCISHSTALHGAERVFLASLRAWHEGGAELWVVFPSILPDYGLRADVEQLIPSDHILTLPYRASGVSQMRTRFVQLYNLYAVRQLTRLVREQHIDAIYSNTSVTILGAQVAQRTGVQHLWHFHEPVNRLYGWVPAMRDLYRRWLKTTETTLIFISQRQRGEWEKELAVPLKHQVIYNPIAVIRTEQPTETRDCLRIGFIGHFEPRKNIPMLIRAFARFQPAHPQSELWLCGATNEAELRDWELDCSAYENIHVLLHTHDVAAFYNQIDILALPSQSETMPLVPIEAMQAGVCVIQTTESGMNELFEDGKDCLFVAPNDEEAWVEALNRCADKKTRTMLASNGQQKIEKTDFNGQYTQSMQQLLCE